MHPNAALIQRFYGAFASGDAETMAQCYHPKISFNDPVFGELNGEEPARMWRSLISRSKGGLKIIWKDVQADDTTGSANWQAEYIFSATSRPVINRIHATFEFADGLIICHRDHFDLWRWARQAMGWKGWLLGWSGYFRRQLRKKTRRLVEM